VLKRLLSAEKRRLLAARFTPVGAATYSQSGEDRIIDFFLGTCGLQNATYIDAGSSHPIFGSNTYLLYRRGLRGICIDPTPGLADLYKRYRPHDLFLPCALVPGSESEVTMQFFTESTINTVSPDHASLFSNFGFAKGATRRVPAIDLIRLCAVHGLIRPDVLCLDIEGLDLAVLTSLDWSKIRPKLICVEVVTYHDDKTAIVDHRIADLLRGVGYNKYADTYINQIFAEETVHASQKLF
jgi:FkbM family methyltransferase